MVEKPSPEEFRGFVRDLGIRAFDQLSSRLAVASEAAAERLERGARRAGSLSRLAACWDGMQTAEKEQFFDQMISAAQALAMETAGEEPYDAELSPKKKAKKKKDVDGRKKKSKKK